MKTVYKVLLCVLFCVVVILSGLRLCLTSTFIDLQYNVFGVPEDTYGFSLQERTEYAYQSIDYLLGKVSDQEFESLTFPDGKALFNQRELSHMQDVRDLSVIVVRVWFIALTALLIGVLAGHKAGWQRESMQAGKTAGLIVLSFILIVLISVTLNFDQLFTAFHRVFFEGDTWLFYSSDSLIRLFPMPFWVNVFVVIGVLSALLSIGLYLFCDKGLKKFKKEVQS